MIDSTSDHLAGACQHLPKPGSALRDNRGSVLQMLNLHLLLFGQLWLVRFVGSIDAVRIVRRRRIFHRVDIDVRLAFDAGVGWFVRGGRLGSVCRPRSIRGGGRGGCRRFGFGASGVAFGDVIGFV